MELPRQVFFAWPFYMLFGGDGFAEDFWPAPSRFEEKRQKAKEQREKNRCEQCGGYRTKYAKLCNKCYKAGRKLAVSECIIKGCTNKPRRKGGLCYTHYYQKNRPKELERKRRANAEAARKYRQVQNRIVEMNKAKTKERIVRVREVPNEAL